MHSHLKTTQSEDVALGFCPLDLYSGDKDRVVKALHILWDIWIGSSGGVNNLKVFVEGHMLKPTSLVSRNSLPVSFPLPYRAVAFVSQTAGEPNITSGY